MIFNLTEERKAQLAEEAGRVLENEAFILSMKNIRHQALEGLATCNPTNTDEIRQHQAAVKFIDEFSAELVGLANLNKPKTRAGIV